MIVFNVIFTTYLLSREMRAHELRDTLQDMRMNRISAVMAERLHVTIDECGNCHTATRNKFLIERD